VYQQGEINYHLQKKGKIQTEKNQGPGKANMLSKNIAFQRTGNKVWEKKSSSLGFFREKSLLTKRSVISWEGGADSRGENLRGLKSVL